MVQMQDILMTPQHLVSVYLKGYNLYIKEHLYRTMMTTLDLHNTFKDSRHIARQSNIY
jgi:hypothetical protein